jgi:hypothetical protein
VPAPNVISSSGAADALNAFRLFPEKHPQLLTEVQALRQEIAALRAELQPSVILTGPAVNELFRRLHESRSQV